MVLRRFTNDETVKFIKLYKKEECLWRTELSSYRDRVAKYVALKRIKNEMNWPEMTVGDVKTKINYLRSSYMQQLGKMKRAKRYYGFTFKPNLQWFYEMDSILNGTKKCEETEEEKQLVSWTNDSDKACGSSSSLENSEETTREENHLWQPKHYMTFIILYREHECLWNPESPMYDDASTRFQALTSIAEKMGFPNFKISEVIKKIRYMQSIYTRELTRIKESLCAKSGVVYKPTMPWFVAMDSFLRNIYSDVVSSKDPLQNEIKMEFPYEGSYEENNQDFVCVDPEPMSLTTVKQNATKRTRERAGSEEQCLIKAAERYETNREQCGASERYGTSGERHGTGGEQSGKSGERSAACKNWSRESGERNAVNEKWSGASEEKIAASRERSGKSGELNAVNEKKSGASGAQCDEFEVFSQHVATQLRSLPLALALEAEEHIQSVLTNYRLKLLRK